MKNKSLLIILALLVVILLAAVPLYRNLSGQVDSTPSGTGQQAEPIAAPDFTFYQLDGTAVNLSDFFGKPIVLNFWASWCGPCQMEMPHFQEKYLELGEEINFLMVNATGGRETLESAVAFIDGNGYSFPVFYDTTYEAAITYGAYSLPITYFIDADGYVIARANGSIDGETLQVVIDMIT
jgi:thiol-disulfide isomerase/thioredoxin